MFWIVKFHKYRKIVLVFGPEGRMNSLRCPSDIWWILLLYNVSNWDIGPAVRVFANGPGDLGSIPGRVIPKTLKMVLDTTLLNTQHYKVRFKGKVEQSWNGVAPSPTPWCSSYRKGSLRVTLDYGRLTIMSVEIQ